MDFKQPPDKNAPMPLWFWSGEPLNRERLAWQLDHFKEQGVLNPCIIYIPRDKGGEPPVYSEEWWEYLEWAVNECRKRGMSLWFSDYNLVGNAHGKIIDQSPDLRLMQLKWHATEVNQAGPVTIHLPDKWRKYPYAKSVDGVPSVLSAAAYKHDGKSLLLSSAIDLRENIHDNTLSWTAPEGGWIVGITFVAGVRKNFPNPLLPSSGRLMIEHHYAEFARRLPGEFGRGFAGIFQDELYLWYMPPWSSTLSGEFLRRKGYDLIPCLPALWEDVGSQTAKVRVDFYDVIVALAEENYFRPIFDYFEKNNVLHAHDNWGRGSLLTQTLRYGDYYRTMRWYSAPGNDDAGRSKGARRNFTDTKMSSSIAQLYSRPLVWVEAFHSSGHGASPSDMMPWLNANFAYGMTAYDFHGVFYTSYGGWCEWAPSSSCFRQPYWRHYDAVAQYITRLCFLLSRGVRRCDVAMLYPVTTMQADLGGHGEMSEVGKAAETAFLKLAEFLFEKGMDLDYLDFESLHRAEIRNGALEVAGGSYQVMLLPAAATVRYSTLEKALMFYRSGGTVLAYGCLPQATDRSGSDDAELNDAIVEMFGMTAADVLASLSPVRQTGPSDGNAIFVSGDYAEVYRLINDTITRDFIASQDSVYVNHRVIDEKDVYFVFNASENTRDLEVFFRARGNPEVWDAWTGDTKTKRNFYCDIEPDGTRMILKSAPYEGQLVVFSGGQGVAEIQDDPTEQAVLPPAIKMDGVWDFQVEPTMDNRWGDFRQPPSARLIGPEARQFRYMAETTNAEDWFSPDFDDSKWPLITFSFGPHFRILGTIPSNTDVKELEDSLSKLKNIDPTTPISVGQTNLTWDSYSLSKRWGIERDPTLGYPHGLDKKIPDDCIDLGVAEPGTKWFLWTAVISPRKINANMIVRRQIPQKWGLVPGFKPDFGVPVEAWLNGCFLTNITTNGEAEVQFDPGANNLLIKLTQPESDGMRHYHPAKGRLRCYVIFKPENEDDLPVQYPELPFAMRWHGLLHSFPYDIWAGRTQQAGWYRFPAPPGLKSISFFAHGEPQVWVNGNPCPVQNGILRSQDGACQFNVNIPNPQTNDSLVVIRLMHQSGFYGGAAIPEPIEFNCVAGRAHLGSWDNIGLSTYAGSAWYRRHVRLGDDWVDKRVVLDLGDVAATAEVRINGQSAGVRITKPWQFDVSAFIRSGDNLVEILVANTLGPHYSVGIPTRYVFEGQTRSGLFGPVKIMALPPENSSSFKEHPN